MSRRSQRRKAISPEPIIISDEDDFVAVASDDNLEDNIDNQDHGKNTTKPARKYGPFVPFVKKKSGATQDVESDNVITEITPPPTPSPVKATSGKKRAVANNDSDEDDVFVPSPTRDSPKKPRAKEPSTPSKISKSERQITFDAAISKARKAATASLPVEKGKAPAPSKSPSKTASPSIDLDDSTVFLADVEMRHVSVPELDKCKIFDKELVDPVLAKTYKELPKLPRMADYAPAWGPRSDKGGFQLSEVLPIYQSPDLEYLKRLITFSHDRRGNIANLSRIDPALLGVKDTNSFAKNVLYLHGNTSDPVLCFSLVLVMSDNHDEGRSLGSEKEWVLKDIAGVLHVMELERFVAVLGLAYDLPYLPDDSARRETDLLHFSMVENSFCFTTSMTHNTDFEKAKGGSSKSTPKRMNKHKIFAPASPAFSGKAATSSSGARKVSLRASDTVPIYDGRKRQLNIPDELRKIPDFLPRYFGDIPQYTLALVAYTVSTYSPTSGARKSQVTANLNIHFGVVLYEPVLEAVDEASGDEE